MDTARRTATRVVAACLAGILILAFAASRVAIAGIASEREYDEGVYLLSARAVVAGHELFSSVFSSQPPAFLESLAMAFRTAGDSLQTARLLILAFALLALVSIADLARRIAATWAAPAAVAALALGATFLDLSHLVESELPSLAVGLASLSACFLARARAWNRGWLFAAGALFGAAALFKLMVVPLTAPLVLLLLLAPARDENEPWAFDGRGLPLVERTAGRLLILGLGVLAVGCLPLFFYNVRDLYQQTIGFHLIKHEVYELHSEGNLLRAGRRMAMDPTILATAGLGLLWLARVRPLVFLWLGCWLAATVVVLMEQTPLFWRHFVLLSPIVALAAAAASSALASRVSVFRGALVTTALMLFWVAPSLVDGSGPFPRFLGPVREARVESPLVDASRWVAANTRADELVAGDDPIVIYLSGRQAPPALCDTSQARIKSESLTLRHATQESSAARLLVLRKDGRLWHLKGYRTWLTLHYEKLPEFSGTRSMWIRKAAASDADDSAAAN